MLRYLVTATQLVAPMADAGGDIPAGFDWCCQAVGSAGFAHAAAVLAQSRAAALLHWGKHGAAVQALKVNLPIPVLVSGETRILISAPAK